jgi:hypothetical protein
MFQNTSSGRAKKTKRDTTASGFYADDVNLLRENINIIKKDT